MRHFSYITVGRILDDLWEDLRDSGASEDTLWYTDKYGLRKKRYPIRRLTLVKLEERLNLPKGRVTHGKLAWRVYSEDEANEIKQKIKKEYNFAGA